QSLFMIKIADKTLEDLEFPTVREQLSHYCLTEMGKEKALHVRPFKNHGDIFFALYQTEEYRLSALDDERIPKHRFDRIDASIHLLSIENSQLELGSFRKIANLSETANAQIRFLRKHRSLYPNLHKTTEEVELTEVIVKNIRGIIDRFGEVRSDASPLLQKTRSSIGQVRSQIDSSFAADLAQYQ